MDLQNDQEFTKRKLKLYEDNTESDNVTTSSDSWIRAINALGKQQGQRGSKEINSILQFLNTSTFIHKLKISNKTLPSQFANRAELEHFSKGKTIFMHGDKPDKFYLIAKGKVSILIPKTKNEIAMLRGETDGAKDSNNNDLNLFFGRSNSNCLTNHHHTIQQYHQILNYQRKRTFDNKRKKSIENCIEDRICPEVALCKTEVMNWRQYYSFDSEVPIMKFNHIKFLRDGEVFGDFGLLVRKPRSACILVVQDTYLLSIQKQDYEDLIQEVQANKMERQRKFFLQSLKLEASNVKQEQLNNIVFDFSTKIKLKQGWYLFNEGEETDSIFLIKRGELQLSKQVRTIFNPSTSMYDFIEEQQFLNSNLNNDNDIDNISRIKYPITQIDFVTIGAGELLGIEDIFQNRKTRRYTAKCISDVVVYQMQKIQLYGYISELYFFKASLKSQAISKEQFHNQRIQQLLQQRKPYQRNSLCSNDAINISSNKNLTNKDNQKKLFKNSEKQLLQKGNEEKIQKRGSKINKHYSDGSLLNSQVSSAAPSLSIIDEQSINQKNNSNIEVSLFQLLQNTTNFLNYEQTPLESPIRKNRGCFSSHLLNKQIIQTRSSYGVIPERKGQSPQFEEMRKEINDPGNYLQEIIEQYQSEQYENYSIEEQNIQKNKGFWFDHNVKESLEKKINISLKEKDFEHIKKIRETFKGNTESCKFGQLDKKINRIIKLKPKLISQINNKTSLQTSDKSKLDQLSSLSPNKELNDQTIINEIIPTNQKESQNLIQVNKEIACQKSERNLSPQKQSSEKKFDLIFTTRKKSDIKSLNYQQYFPSSKCSRKKPLQNISMDSQYSQILPKSSQNSLKDLLINIPSKSMTFKKYLQASQSLCKLSSTDIASNINLSLNNNQKQIINSSPQTLSSTFNLDNSLKSNFFMSLSPNANTPVQIQSLSQKLSSSNLKQFPDNQKEREDSFKNQQLTSSQNLSSLSTNIFNNNIKNILQINQFHIIQQSFTQKLSKKACLSMHMPLNQKDLKDPQTIKPKQNSIQKKKFSLDCLLPAGKSKEKDTHLLN